MNKLLKTSIFQLSCIIFFIFIYHIFDAHFDFDYNDKKKQNSWVDYTLLSVTIQCSTGISNLVPVTNFGKILLIFHQLVVLYLHFITIYILNF